MTITYLIGNGFDLGLGLKTGYRDFVKWYREQKPEDSDNVRWLKEQMAEENIKLWGDAEMAFGKLEFYKQGDAEEVYNECYDDFTDSFLEYYQREKDRLKIPDQDRQKVAEQFLRQVIDLHEFMASGMADHYLKSVNVQSVTVNFITFNYTDTLERILNFSGDQQREYRVELVPNRPLKVVVDKVCHVHGTLDADDADFVFGVDNAEQIGDPKVRRLCERTGGMIKPLADEKIGLWNRRRGFEFIEQSDVLVTFGLSYGLSDTSWWQAIHDFVFKKERLLIACPFKSQVPTHLTAKKRNDIFVAEKKKIFLSLKGKIEGLDEQLESADYSQITVLKPQSVKDGLEKEHPYDYWHLSDLRRLYTEAEGGTKKGDEEKGEKPIPVAPTIVQPKPKEPEPGEERTVALPGGAEMTFCWCPATTSEAWKRISGGKDFFWMGSPTSEVGRGRDETLHRVTLTRGFWMGKHPVTQRQWRSVTGGNPSRFKGDDRPVECVSWYDCQEFIERVNAAGGIRVALPTEAQWEYACRAGTITPFSFGSVLNGTRANCDGTEPYGTLTEGPYRRETTAAGKFAPNAWGLCDMHGNVWEWCADRYGAYGGYYATDPAGAASGSNRVLRGGGWNYIASLCRSAFRGCLNPSRNYIFSSGFRLCCVLGLQ